MSRITPPLFGHFAYPSKASPATDPRIDPRMLRAITKLGVNAAAPTPPLNRGTASLQDMIDYAYSSEKAMEALHELIVDSEDGSGVLYNVEHVKKPDDGFQIDLHVHRPADRPNETLPAIVVIHGGAQVIFGAYSVLYRKWAHDLARRGLIAINVAYRNAMHGNKEHHPFPTGLNDCIAAVRWISENRARLGCSKLIIEGESGGANLAVATTMQLLRDGHDNIIDGVFAMSPYVSGAYGKSEEWKIQQGLASLVECDGYIFNAETLDILTAIYDPSGENETNPLAWPWYGSPTDFERFPLTVITVDELDPLRDEGIALARKMAAAGVRVISRTNLGMMHSAALWQSLLRDLYDTYTGDIKRFADSI